MSIHTVMNNASFMQAHAVQDERAHHWNIFSHQLCCEHMLFANLIFCPTIRAVKLSHHRAVVIQMHLVNTVFIGAEGAHATIYRQT